MLPANCCCGTVAPVNIVGPPGASASGADGADGAIVLLGQGVSLDFNSAGDTGRTITGFPASYIITQIIVYSASAALLAAVGGIYTEAAKAGTVVVAASQTYAAVSDLNKWMQLSLEPAVQSGHDVFTADTLYLYIETPSGSGATATVNVYGYAL